MQNSEIIATKVHGWEIINHGGLIYKGKGRPHRDNLFDPENNVDQAIAALEAWKVSGEFQRDWDLSSGFCRLQEFRPHEYDLDIRSTNKSLSAAIVEALVQATKEQLGD